MQDEIWRLPKSDCSDLRPGRFRKGQGTIEFVGLSTPELIFGMFGGFGVSGLGFQDMGVWLELDEIPRGELEVVVVYLETKRC